MCQKGFTLAELLGVIALIGVLALLVTPVVDRALKKNKESLYQTQISNIKKGAEQWGANNPFLLPEKEGDSFTLTLSQLKQAGTVEVDITNPKTKELFANDLLITITKTVNGLVFEVLEDSGSKENQKPFDVNAPVILLKGKATEHLEVDTSNHKIYQDPGVLAKKSDGTIIPTVDTKIETKNTVVSSIPFNTLGTYTITYTATDQSLKTNITRVVVVEDTMPPFLLVPDDIQITSLEAKTFNVRANVIATDNSGNCTYQVSSSLSDVPGVYEITYLATDGSNNKTVQKRIITVVREK